MQGTRLLPQHVEQAVLLPAEAALLRDIKYFEWNRSLDDGRSCEGGHEAALQYVPGEKIPLSERVPLCEFEAEVEI